MKRIYSLTVPAAYLILALRLSAAESAPTAPAFPPEPAPAVVKLSTEQIAAFRYSVEKSRLEAGLPGLAVALVQPGQILLLDGFGKRSAALDASVTADTRFALGPATAAVNSLLLARLAAQNQLDLGAPARRCWDEFRLADATATRTVTLGHLLGMTAGLPDRADTFLKAAGCSPADLFAIAGEIPVTAQPGRAFNYSDASAALAGYLAVYAANQHHAPAAGLAAGYAALANTQLFEPLGMKRATYDAPSAAPGDDDAVGHIRDGKGSWQPAPAAAAPGQALLPALGLQASARDVAAWLQCEISSGLGPNGQRLLGEAAVQARWRPAAVLDSQGYGLGWAQQHYRGVEIIGHMGEQNHQSELVAILPQYRTAIAVLTNGDGHDAEVFLQNALLNLADLLREAAGK